MRVWVISSSYPRTPRESVNAGVLARDLALSLARLDHETVVVTPTKPGGVTFDPELEGVGFSWYRPTIEISDLGMTPRDVTRAATLMVSGYATGVRLGRSRPPNAVIGLWALPSGIFARSIARSLGIPYGIWLLGSDVWRADQFPFGKRALTAVCRDATALAADGRSLAQEAMTLTGARVDYLPSARRLPTDGGRIFRSTDVVFIGRYHANKGPDVLLDALRTPGYGDISAEFYGAGDLRDALKQGAKQLDAVNVHGPIDGEMLRSRLQSCRALIVPSRVESVPLVLGDAIQARRPVVVTDAGDMADIVHKYRLGTVAKAGDPEDLARAIRLLFDSPPAPDWDGALRSLGPDRPASYFLERLTLRPGIRTPLDETPEEGGLRQ